MKMNLLVAILGMCSILSVGQVAAEPDDSNNEVIETTEIEACKESLGPGYIPGVDWIGEVEGVDGDRVVVGYEDYAGICGLD